MKVRELLPIGSVVLLKGGKRPLMIFGIKQSDKETGNEYDYIGVLYPEGNMSRETQFLFRHEDIETVEFRGYEDERREEFIRRLSGFYHEED